MDEPAPCLARQVSRGAEKPVTHALLVLGYIIIAIPAILFPPFMADAFRAVSVDNDVTLVPVNKLPRRIVRRERHRLNGFRWFEQLHRPYTVLVPFTFRRFTEIG